MSGNRRHRLSRPIHGKLAVLSTWLGRSHCNDWIRSRTHKSLSPIQIHTRSLDIRRCILLNFRCRTLDFFQDSNPNISLERIQDIAPVHSQRGKKRSPKGRRISLSLCRRFLLRKKIRVDRLLGRLLAVDRDRALPCTGLLGIGRCDNRAHSARSWTGIRIFRSPDCTCRLQRTEDSIHPRIRLREDLYK